MSRRRKILHLLPLLFLALPTALAGQRTVGEAGPEADFLRGVAEYYNVTPDEVFVLAQWGMTPAEVPVVLFLAGRAGVSPDVVVAQRQRGRDWRTIAQGLGVHAGDFYVRIQGSPGFLSEAYQRFNNTPAAQWGDVALSDQDIVGLVNVRFLSRFLEVAPAEVIRALGRGPSVVEGYRALAGRRMQGE